jgi:nucleoside-diphosphate-sugar epimerase
MKILLAGATGAIGLPLIAQLISAGETVVGIARSTDTANVLKEAGADSIQADALDAPSILNAVKHLRPDAIINQLTSLPKHYTSEEMRTAADRDRTVRTQGNANLLAAAEAVGVRRYLLQSSAFFYAPGPGLATENDPLAVDASPGVAASARTYTALEASLLEHPAIETTALRYGFFYGPGTWFSKEGDMGNQVRQGSLAVIGSGAGLYNFVHIDDAAAATIAALHCAPGIYNVTGDQPCEQRLWLRAFARYVGAQPPPQLSEEQAMAAAGPDAVFYATRLRGASNAKAKRDLHFAPQPLEWLSS